MRPGVVEVKNYVVLESLAQAELRSIVVRTAYTGESRQRAKLRLEEHIVEEPRSATERAACAIWAVVPNQLQESKVSYVPATEGRRRQPRIGRLGRSETRVAPPLRLEREEMFEERDWSNRIDGTILIPRINQQTHRLVEGHSRRWITQIV